MADSSYTGRFAPSPTGALHFGSLIAAVASYLDARHHQGRWLLRIEDLDTFREVSGAADLIQSSLQAHGFDWDGEVTFQQQRTALYQAALDALAHDCFACQCTRKQLRAQAEYGAYGLIYPGTCRTLALPFDQPHTAIRIRSDDRSIDFTDQIQGRHCQNPARDIGDFVIKRSDGLFAYQLAVVVDDACQGITHVVRGSDLLDNTPRQQFLQQKLGYPSLTYAHLPLASHADGDKLSKQTHAPALDNRHPLSNITRVLQFLNQPLPEEAAHSAASCFASLNECWDWAIRHWDLQRIPRTLSIALPKAVYTPDSTP